MTQPIIHWPEMSLEVHAKPISFLMRRSYTPARMNQSGEELTRRAHTIQEYADAFFSEMQTYYAQIQINTPTLQHLYDMDGALLLLLRYRTQLSRVLQEIEQVQKPHETVLAIRTIIEKQMACINAVSIFLQNITLGRGVSLITQDMQVHYTVNESN